MMTRSIVLFGSWIIVNRGRDGGKTMKWSFSRFAFRMYKKYSKGE
jgi:hypothetical protein